jgi:hypothetical protein
VDKLNSSGRRPGGSELIALDIDEPGVDGLYNLRAVKPIGYTGAKGEGDSELDFLGFDAEILDGDTINFYIVNERPPIGPFNNIIDATVLGANSTIDVFEMKRGADVMRHLRTIWSPDVPTPNRVAILGQGDFVVTNDHSTKTGWVRLLPTLSLIHTTHTSVAQSSRPLHRRRHRRFLRQQRRMPYRRTRRRTRSPTPT